MEIRPMRGSDVAVAESLSDEAFAALPQRSAGAARSARRTSAHSAAWVRRTTHLVGTDPGGCWVAEDEGRMIGFATSFVRETTWFLATYAVRPDRQGGGIGTALLAAAMHHGRACLHAMLSASEDPRAVRRYKLAGFDLHPQMHLTGTVDRTTIPVIEKVRDGSAADIDLLDSLDRATRGAAHGPDHELLLAGGRLLVSDTSTGSGYAYVEATGRVVLLAAGNRRTASRLLWAALADLSGPVVVPNLTAANQWALDVGVAARLQLGQGGYLALKGLRAPAPYIHHSALL
ncbi:GNAT family N-acetyltransferase [Nocardioides sp. CER19]|uniref:GNAT family N-acetyltransferase n=1 Tax=Nocardioides sp. CER19 TaxID=3038538 RepID=UPI002448478D|nr:GNAT family N-acetyltransferase [Nocardioides sp. CER19]MDH2416789.1 GNAT family N-acetyltransferase [Nocardioides sp. CER19]